MNFLKFLFLVISMLWASQALSQCSCEESNIVVPDAYATGTSNPALIDPYMLVYDDLVEFCGHSISTGNPFQKAWKKCPTANCTDGTLVTAWEDHVFYFNNNFDSYTPTSSGHYKFCLREGPGCPEVCGKTDFINLEGDCSCSTNMDGSLGSYSVSGTSVTKTGLDVCGQLSSQYQGLWVWCEAASAATFCNTPDYLPVRGSFWSSSTPLTITAPRTGKYFYCVRDGSNCNTIDDEGIFVSVPCNTSAFTAGTIINSYTYCEPTNPPKLTGTLATGCSGGILEYLWQTKTSNGAWEDILHSDLVDYDPYIISTIGTHFYRRAAMCDPCNSIVYSNEITITVGDCCTAPTPTTTDETVCNGTSTTLTSTGCTAGYTATWYTNAAATTAAPGNNTSNSYTTSVLTATTTYYVVCIDDADDTCKSEPVAAVATAEICCESTRCATATISRN